MAMEKTAEAEGGGDGMGTSLGLMMPAMFAQYFTAAKSPSGKTQTTLPTDGQSPYACPECHSPIDVAAKFCSACGHQQVVVRECNHCGKNLTANAKFCSRCGHPADEKPPPKTCNQCSAENLADSRFCVQCGERL